MILGLLLTSLIGFFTKTCDLCFDDGLHSRETGIISALFYGVLIFVLLNQFPVFSSMCTGVVLSLLVTRKIDNVAHFVGVGIAFSLLLMSGFPEIDIILIMVFALSSTMDEILKDFSDRRHVRGIAGKFISARPFLEISTLLVSVITGIWILFIGILVFDVAYIMTERLSKRFFA